MSTEGSIEDDEFKMQRKGFRLVLCQPKGRRAHSKYRGGHVTGEQCVPSVFWSFCLLVLAHADLTIYFQPFASIYICKLIQNEKRLQACSEEGKVRQQGRVWPIP